MKRVSSQFVGDPTQAIVQYGRRIVEQLDFENDRIRPFAAVDAAVSTILFKTQRREVRTRSVRPSERHSPLSV